MTNKVYDLISSLSRLSLKKNIKPPGELTYLFGCIRSVVGSAGGVKDVGSMKFVYGQTNQTFVGVEYAGLQCTSMSLAAIIQNKIYDIFSPQRINSILDEGNRLHTFLRTDVRLSDNPDGRIAIEDLPSRYRLYIGKVFGRDTFVRLLQDCQNVFTSKRKDFDCFCTIKEYLEQWLAKGRKRTGFLLTIDEATYAIILSKNGTAVLFDSHGHLRYKGRIIKRKAGAMTFPCLNDLEDFLIGMYGKETHAVIAPVLVIFLTRPCPTKVAKKASTEHQDYKPYFTEDSDGTKINVGEEKETESVSSLDDMSAYIGMMGGGC